MEVTFFSLFRLRGCGLATLNLATNKIALPENLNGRCYTFVCLGFERESEN